MTTTAIDRVRNYLADPQQAAAIASAGKLSDDERKQIQRMILTQCMKPGADKLLEAAARNPASLALAAQQALLVGLIPDGTMAYLVPYKGTVTFIPGYQGLVQLMYRSSLVAEIVAHNVFRAEFDNPSFRLDYSRSPVVQGHVPLPPGKRGDYVGTYAICRLTNGGCPSVWMWREEVEAVRDRSASAGASFSPWNHKDDFFEMAKKTAIKRLRKLCPQSPELIRAVQQDDAYESGMIDVQAESAPAQEPVRISRVKARAKAMAAHEAAMSGDIPIPPDSLMYQESTEPLCPPDLAKKIKDKLAVMDKQERDKVLANWNLEWLTIGTGLLKMGERDANDLLIAVGG